MSKKDVLNEKEVFADYDLGIPWLRKQRRLRRGPIFLRIGRMIKYRREDIESYLIDHMVNTSDNGE